jgi:hypothetical protein
MGNDGFCVETVVIYTLDVTKVNSTISFLPGLSNGFSVNRLWMR